MPHAPARVLEAQLGLLVAEMPGLLAPPPSFSLLSLPPSFPPDAIFLVQYLGKDTASFSICKLFTNYMHRRMWSKHILHRPECGSGEDCGFVSLEGWASHQAWTYLHAFSLTISKPRLFFIFLAVGGERGPIENLETKHILLPKTPQKTKEKLSLCILFLLVFLYFQIYLHEGKKFSHQPSFMIITERQ